MSRRLTKFIGSRGFHSLPWWAVLAYMDCLAIKPRLNFTLLKRRLL